MCVSLFVRRDTDSIGLPDRETDGGEPSAGGREEEGRAGGPGEIVPRNGGDEDITVSNDRTEVAEKTPAQRGTGGLTTDRTLNPERVMRAFGRLGGMLARTQAALVSLSSRDDTETSCARRRDRWYQSSL